MPYLQWEPSRSCGLLLAPLKQSDGRFGLSLLAREGMIGLSHETQSQEDRNRDQGYHQQPMAAASSAACSAVGIEHRRHHGFQVFLGVLGRYVGGRSTRIHILGCFWVDH